MICESEGRPLIRVRSERGLDTTCRTQRQLLVQGQHHLVFHTKCRNAFRVVRILTNNDARSFFCQARNRQTSLQEIIDQPITWMFHIIDLLVISALLRQRDKFHIVHP